MTQRTDDVTQYRYVVSAEATEQQLRQCGYALLSHCLAVHRVLAAHLELQPIELLILIATTTGNVQRAVQPRVRQSGRSSREPLAPHMVVPMSRRAIARITGIPKETVRRHVASMVRRGILRATPRGVHAPNRLTERKAVTAILELMQLHAQCTEQLGAMQAIIPQAADRLQASRRR